MIDQDVAECILRSDFVQLTYVRVRTEMILKLRDPHAYKNESKIIVFSSEL